MEIFNNNKESKCPYRFSDNFIYLIKLKLALDIAKEETGELNLDDVGTPQYWTIEKVVSATKISNITVRRCFGLVAYEGKPSEKTLKKFYDFLGFEEMAIRVNTPNDLSAMIKERYGIPKGNHIFSVFVMPDTPKTCIKEVNGTTLYVVSSGLLKKSCVELKVHNRAKKYRFQKISDERNRFTVIAAPDESILNVGDRLTIETFALGVKINGYDYWRCYDSLCESQPSVYISKEYIEEISVFFIPI